ncbi:hypothetical protein [Sphingobacterium cellulitidis]|uniref:hypothetical protein n=1 Tax=Sphingobacterium cellulitidis TaxID=1768011 RepID=UPI003C7C09AC
MGRDSCAGPKEAMVFPPIKGREGTSYISVRPKVPRMARVAIKSSPRNSLSSCAFTLGHIGTRQVDRKSNGIPCWTCWKSTIPQRTVPGKEAWLRQCSLNWQTLVSRSPNRP